MYPFLDKTNNMNNPATPKTKPTVPTWEHVWREVRKIKYQSRLRAYGATGITKDTTKDTCPPLQPCKL